MIAKITEITDGIGWIEMWLFSTLMFVLAKGAIVGQGGIQPDGATLTFVTLWPGFDLRAWRRQGLDKPSLFLRGLVNLVCGAALVWVVARYAPTPFISTWVCMIGFVIALHGGVFTLLTEFWRKQGRDVSPLMNCPLAAASVTEFWGKRWNLGFRDLAHTLIFKPALARFGKVGAMMMVFLVSGVAHELVITVPSRGGYGGPTLYFMLQGLCIWIERGCPFKRNGLVWRVRAWLFLILPLPLLFPTVFVERVMLPFFTFIHALP